METRQSGGTTHEGMKKTITTESLAIRGGEEARTGTLSFKYWG
jgi:hypothetical protein